MRDQNVVHNHNMRITPVKGVVCRTESGDKLLQRAPIIIVSVIPIRHKRAVVVVAGALASGASENIVEDTYGPDAE